MSEATTADCRAEDENLAARLWDAGLTVVRILNLPAMLCSERLPDAVTGDDWDADPTDTLKELLGHFTEEESGMWWEEVWWLYRKLYEDGQPPRWLVLVERQVPFNIKFDDDGEARGWSLGGTFAQKWVSGVTFDDAMTAGTEWSAATLAEEIAAAKAEQTSSGAVSP